VTTGTGVGAGARAVIVIATTFVGAFVTLVTALAFLGSTWWVFDFFANFRWQFMWLALACAIIYALTAKGLASVVFIAAAIVNGFVLSPLWFGSQPAGTGENGVTVVSLDMDGSTSDEERVLNWLFDTDADLIIVSGVSDARLQPLVVDGSPYQTIVAPPENSTGIAIIGKGPFTSEERRTGATDEPIYLINLPSGEDVITVVTAWAELATSADAAGAVAERTATIHEIVRTRSHPVAVIGPLGATRFTSPMRDLLSTSGLRDASEGSGYLATTPVSGIPLIGGWIGIPLDVVLMTADITPLGLESGPDVGVNHLPISVTIGPVTQG
jgi:endonuclease/exonuclease/phosphatase (EEP) superfamily protein YafD